MFSINVKNKYTGLIRDPSKILSNLVVTETDQVITLKEAKIQTPVRYINRNLSNIDMETNIYGIYALIMEDEYYAVSDITAKIPINPYKIVIEKVRGIEYHSFYFEPNTIMINNLNVVQQDTLMYNLLDEFDFLGKIPWYLTMEDLAKLFDKAKDFAGSDVASRYETIELLVSIISRQSNDRDKFYRTLIKDKNELLSNPPDFIPLNSVFYLPDTYNKLAGNRLDQGIISSLINPNENIEHIEQLLRS